jgi:hypothetical protein
MRPVSGRRTPAFGIASAWRGSPLTVATMLRPRRGTCVLRRLLPVIRAKVGKHWTARLPLLLCLSKQCCWTSTPTSSQTDSRTAPAMQPFRPRRRGDWSVVLCTSELAVPDSLACICNAGGRRPAAPDHDCVGRAGEAAVARRRARRRSQAVRSKGSSRPACTSAPAGSLAAILQARRAGACSVSARSASAQHGAVIPVREEEQVRARHCHRTSV